MYCFKDGTNYTIGDYEFSYTEDGKDNDVALLPEKCLRKFQTIVKEFKSDYILELVYSEYYEYYFVAFIGMNENDFKWTNEMNVLYSKLGVYLQINKIIFG